MKRIKTIAVAAGVTAAVTSLSVGAWAATGGSHPAPPKKQAAASPRKADAAAVPADAPSTAARPKSGPTGLFKSGQILRPRTGTGGHAGATLAVQDDGNLVVYGKDHRAIWSSKK